eukprot:maker-scaffold_15-snap-gene-2.26-mRNA-1 protein AED:0.00 eAED:0.00 QI:409/1/1/1/1/1/3/135/631
MSFMNLSQKITRKLSRAKVNSRSEDSIGSITQGLDEALKDGSMMEQKKDGPKKLQEVDVNEGLHEVKRERKAKKSLRKSVKSPAKSVGSSVHKTSRLSMNRAKASVIYGMSQLQKNLKKQELMSRMKKRTRASSSANKPELPLQDEQGYAPKKSGKMMQRWKKMRQKTAAFSKNIRLRGFRVGSEADFRSRGESRMDQPTRQLFMELKNYGKVNSLEDAVDVLKKMEENKKSGPIIALGFASLSAIASQEATGLIQNGALDLVVHAFDKFKASPSVNRNTCLFLWNILVDREARKKLLPQAEDDIPELHMDLEQRIVDCMNFHKESVKVLPKACGALKLLLNNPYSKQKLLDLGVLDLIISSYKLFTTETPEKSQYQTVCISCIQNLAYSANYKTDSDSQKFVVKDLFDAQAPELIIKSMAKFIKVADLQSAGCAAIWNLSIPDETKTDLVSLGAGNRLLKAIMSWRDDAEIIIHAFGALKNLVKGENSDELLSMVREKVHSELGEEELGKINIYDVLFDAYFDHQENDSNIRRIGEALIESFEIEDNENVNRNLEGEEKEEKKEETTSVTVSPKQRGSLIHPSSKVSSIGSFRNLSVVDDIEYDPNDPFGNLEVETEPDHFDEEKGDLEI